MLLLDEAHLLLVDSVADKLADRIVESIAEDGGGAEGNQQQLDVENTGGGKGPGREQQ